MFDGAGKYFARISSSETISCMFTRSCSSAKFRIFKAIEKWMLCCSSMSVSWVRTIAGKLLAITALLADVTGVRMLFSNTLWVLSGAASDTNSNPGNKRTAQKIGANLRTAHREEPASRIKSIGRISRISRRAKRYRRESLGSETDYRKKSRKKINRGKRDLCGK
jgi:hypothetical protein